MYICILSPYEIFSTLRVGILLYTAIQCFPCEDWLVGKEGETERRKQCGGVEPEDSVQCST